MVILNKYRHAHLMMMRQWLHGLWSKSFKVGVHIKCFKKFKHSYKHKLVLLLHLMCEDEIKV